MGACTVCEVQLLFLDISPHSLHCPFRRVQRSCSVLISHRVVTYRWVGVDGESPVRLFGLARILKKNHENSPKITKFQKIYTHKIQAFNSKFKNWNSASFFSLQKRCPIIIESTKLRFTWDANSATNCGSPSFNNFKNVGIPVSTNCWYNGDAKIACQSRTFRQFLLFSNI